LTGFVITYQNTVKKPITVMYEEVRTSHLFSRLGLINKISPVSSNPATSRTVLLEQLLLCD